MGKVFVIVLICINLSACASDNPVVFYEPVEDFKKIDSKAKVFPLPNEAPDMESLNKYREVKVKSSYKLDGLEEFIDLDIVQNAEIKKSRINVEFLCKSMSDNQEEDISKYIWENALFLLYTINDTFPEVDDIRLYSNYYFLDLYGHPYREAIFIANTKRKVVEKINRDFYRDEMLQDLLDYYLAEESIKYYKKE